MLEGICVFIQDSRVNYKPEKRMVNFIVIKNNRTSVYKLVKVADKEMVIIKRECPRLLNF